jgi:hypothetical protein
MATRFLHRMKFFEQLWKPFTLGSILPSLVEIGLVVFHKKIFEFHYIHTYTHTQTHTHTGDAIIHHISDAAVA